MAHLLLLTNALAPSAEVLPALGLLSHHVRILPAEPTALIDAPPADAVLVDARRELAMARSLCRVIHTTGLSAPLFAVLTEGGLAGLTPEWGIDDVLLDTAGPAEVEARLADRMTSAWQQVIAEADRCALPLRTAATCLAVRRVAEAHQLRGLYP